MSNILFVGSECDPFVKTGGLADVMSALPRALANQGDLDVRVILPRYTCIPEHFRNNMTYVTHFYMDFTRDCHMYYVGLMEYWWNGVRFYFIDNEYFFGRGNPYTDMAGDIVPFIFFSKAVLASMCAIGFHPDVIHCHDWQAALVPVYLHTLYEGNPFYNGTKTVLTIHNLHFQGIANIDTVKYHSNIPEYAFSPDRLEFNADANIMKGGIVYSNFVTTVSHTYANEIRTPEYGEALEGVLNDYAYKLGGIVNGVDYDVYNPGTDWYIYDRYGVDNFPDAKRWNKEKLQAELGLERNVNKFMIGIISRLTDQKGLDLVNEVMNRIVDDHTQVVIIGTGDKKYEEAFRNYENYHRGRVCSNIMYSNERAHKLYAAADAILVPSRFEPCGLTQLIAMRYGTVPIVRETGGLRDTVQPYNGFDHTGTGFTFYEYNSEIMLKVINYAKQIFFEDRFGWECIARRGMESDFSWYRSAGDYRNIYNWLMSQW